MNIMILNVLLKLLIVKTMIHQVTAQYEILDMNYIIYYAILKLRDVKSTVRQVNVLNVNWVMTFRVQNVLQK